jgi:hypothetical protein
MISAPRNSVTVRPLNSGATNDITVLREGTPPFPIKRYGNASGHRQCDRVFGFHFYDW